jgi:S1-C subfamily serine protease
VAKASKFKRKGKLMHSNTKLWCFFLVFSLSTVFSSGCMTLPVSGYLGNSKEEFLGRATGYVTRTGVLNITTISGVKCEGDFEYETSSNGKGNFKCADGQFGDFLFTSNGREGEGFGKTNKGEPFFFQFGSPHHSKPSQKANSQNRKPIPPSQPSVKQQTVSGGTGFMFSAKDYVITNFHVVKGASSILAKFTNGQTVEAVVVAKDPKNDIAILKLAKSPPMSATSIKLGDSSQARAGEKIFTIGYPASKIMGEKPKYSEGVINSMTGLKDDPAFFQVSVPVQPGNSGGPLFNERGEVIGITTSSLSLLAIDAMGAIPQNVNYAIKSSFVKNLLSTIPELMLANTGIVVIPNEPGNSLPNFIEQASKNIVLIEAKE